MSTLELSLLLEIYVSFSSRILAISLVRTPILATNIIFLSYIHYLRINTNHYSVAPIISRVSFPSFLIRSLTCGYLIGPHECWHGMSDERKEARKVEIQLLVR